MSEMLAIEIDPLLVSRLNDSDQLKKLKVVNKDILMTNIYDFQWGFRIANPTNLLKII